MSTPLDCALSFYDRYFTRAWKTAFEEFHAHKKGNRFWMTGPSSFIFHLGGERFGLDLQIRREKDLNALRAGLAEDTRDLSFILITHQHDDHFCIPLMRALKDTNIRWYLPFGTREKYVTAAGLRAENLVFVRPGDTWREGSLRFHAFYSPHVTPDEAAFPQCGYEITAPCGKILIPGDVRDHDYCNYPDFGRVDYCFANFWAGREPEEYRSELERFVRFYAKLHAGTYYLCHLYEIGRDPAQMWRYTHAGEAMELFWKIAPESAVEIPRIGQSYSLTR